jgi:RNA polymerase sigma factor (sigma-70 family)
MLNLLIDSDKAGQIDAADHIGLARSVAKLYADPKVSLLDSDEYSEACHALVKIADNYNPSDGEFHIVAWRKMKQAIIDSYRHNQRLKRKGQFDKGADLNEIPSREDGNPLPNDLLDRMLADSEDETQQDITDKLILIEVYIGGVSPPVLADRLCVSRQTIYNRIGRCLQKVRERHADLIEQYSEEVQ